MKERSSVLERHGSNVFSHRRGMYTEPDKSSFAETYRRLNFEHITHPFCEEILLSSLSYFRANPIKEKEEDTKLN